MKFILSVVSVLASSITLVCVSRVMKEISSDRNSVTISTMEITDIIAPKLVAGVRTCITSKRQVCREGVRRTISKHRIYIIIQRTGFVTLSLCHFFVFFFSNNFNLPSRVKRYGSAMLEARLTFGQVRRYATEKVYAA